MAGAIRKATSEALPDFVKLAEAYGLKGLRAETAGDLDGVIEEMLAHDGPVLCDIAVDPAENCYPMIPSGAAHNDMLLAPLGEGHEAVSAEGRVLV
jgi:acetolactate synthase-1/2/3 large subunit